MNKTSMLELAKKLNILRQNCMKTKEELQEAIKDTIKQYKEISFWPRYPSQYGCLDGPRKQQVINEKNI